MEGVIVFNKTFQYSKLKNGIAKPRPKMLVNGFISLGAKHKVLSNNGFI